MHFRAWPRWDYRPFAAACVLLMGSTGYAETQRAPTPESILEVFERIREPQQTDSLFDVPIEQRVFAKAFPVAETVDAVLAANEVSGVRGDETIYFHAIVARLDLNPRRVADHLIAQHFEAARGPRGGFAYGLLNSIEASVGARELYGHHLRADDAKEDDPKVRFFAERIIRAEFIEGLPGLLVRFWPERRVEVLRLAKKIDDLEWHRQHNVPASEAMRESAVEAARALYETDVWVAARYVDEVRRINRYLDLRLSETDHAAREVAR
ncbi:MAG: hypothetical protein AAF663_10185 [Planctomycetota bacterium]